jgi:hypothetical protein
MYSSSSASASRVSYGSPVIWAQEAHIIRIQIKKTRQQQRK